MTLEKIDFYGDTYALILRKNLDIENTTYFSTNDDSLQLGILKFKKGYSTRPHIHKSSMRTVYQTQEILHVTSGIIEIYFYDIEHKNSKNAVLGEGDTVFIMKGGHRLKIDDDAKIIIVKQGPYSNIEHDKEFIDDKEFLQDI